MAFWKRKFLDSEWLKMRRGFVRCFLNCQRNAVTVADQMTLAAGLGPIGRIGTGLLPPKTALIELLSTTARDQSILSEQASQSRIAKWINCRIPASCLLAVAQATPARHAGATLQLLRQHFPRNASAQHEYDARKTRPVWQTRPATPLGFAFALGMKNSTILQGCNGHRETSNTEHIPSA
jgi:hypothetical protein